MAYDGLEIGDKIRVLNPDIEPQNDGTFKDLTKRTFVNNDILQQRGVGYDAKFIGSDAFGDLYDIVSADVFTNFDNLYYKTFLKNGKIHLSVTGLSLVPLDDKTFGFRFPQIGSVDQQIYITETLFNVQLLDELKEGQSNIQVDIIKTDQSNVTVGTPLTEGGSAHVDKLGVEIATVIDKNTLTVSSGTNIRGVNTTVSFKKTEVFSPSLGQTSDLDFPFIMKENEWLIFNAKNIAVPAGGGVNLILDIAMVGTIVNITDLV